MANLVKRALGAVQFAAGTRQLLDIDRDGVLHQINLDISFSITGVAATAGPLNECLARVITRCELIINGQDTVWNLSGELMASRARYEYSAMPYGFDSTVVVGAATTAYRIVLPMLFTLPRGRRPDDTSVDCRQFRQVTLAITWQAQGLGDFFTTPGVAATYQSLICNVEGIYSVQVDAAKSYLIRAIDQVYQDVPNTNANLPVLQDRGDLYYRGFHLVSTAAELAVNNIINNIRLEAGSFVFANRSQVFQAADLIREYGLPLSTTYMPVPSGVYRIDPIIWGEGGTMIAMALLTADLYLKFDVTKQAGTNTIKISREVVRQPRVSG